MKKEEENGRTEKEIKGIGKERVTGTVPVEDKEKMRKKKKIEEMRGKRGE